MSFIPDRGYVVGINLDPQAVHADQVKSLDWKARGAKKKARISEDELSETLNKLKTVIDF